MRGKVLQGTGAALRFARGQSAGTGAPRTCSSEVVYTEDVNSSEVVYTEDVNSPEVVNIKMSTDASAAAALATPPTHERRVPTHHAGTQASSRTL